MARTPSSSKPNHSQHTHAKTPQSKHRLHFGAPKIAHPSPNPKETPSAEHPVEVIGRIRDFPDRREKPISALQINRDRGTVRIRADFGYRDFSLDGVSLSEEEDLEGFYKKFVQSRIQGVKLGDKCTIMMYGPTGSGKSHTMFGCSKLPGIVYRSLMDILGEGGEENDGNPRLGTFVQVTVLEIYNEEIYDLLSSNGGGGGVGLGLPKGSASKVRLEVMGKKAKNATFISGTEAGKISKEIQKVEKRRIVKSTLCNERSSRSHCMIILDVPTVGGRLMLVDMAGSENIDQAGQVGFEAKQQTAKINQGNVSLKRVVESIANGDSHVPFRDSKLTMLLQDSFEDDKSKILMILCASPDPKEIHKTSSTLEYGAKAKCIVRGPHTPTKGKIGSEDASTVILGSRIAAMDQFIYKLQMENKERERERNEAQKQLSKREEEVSQLRAKIEVMGGKGIIGSSEEEINSKVNERTQFLKSELERKLKECQKMADEFVELSRKRMEDKIVQQQLEVEMLRRRLEEIESEVSRPRDYNSEGNVPRNGDGISFAKKLLDIYGDEDPGMVKSMDLETGEQESSAHGTMHGFGNQRCANYPQLKALKDKEDYDVLAPKYSGRVGLSTVFEEEEVEEKEEYMEKSEVEEVKKEMIEEKTVFGSQPPQNIAVLTPHLSSRSPENIDYAKDTASSRRTRIQNIFTLCGNYRELSQHISTPVPPKRSPKTHDPRSSPVKLFSDENSPAEKVPPSLEPFPLVKTLNAEKLTGGPQMRNEVTDVNSIEVCVKWEASNQAPGKFITTLRVEKDSSLSDLRKLIEIDLGVDNQAFTFLVLGDTNGVFVPREREANIKASQLPIINNQSCTRLICLRPAKGSQRPSDLPLSPLENRLLFTPNHCFTQQTDCLSPKSAVSFSSTPYITVRRH